MYILLDLWMDGQTNDSGSAALKGLFTPALFSLPWTAAVVLALPLP